MEQVYPYFYAWKNNAKRAEFYRRRCRVLARGTMNSVMIEFEDGERTITSRFAVRKIKEPHRERTSLDA